MEEALKNLCAPDFIRNARFSGIGGKRRPFEVTHGEQLIHVSAPVFTVNTHAYRWRLFSLPARRAI